MSTRFVKPNALAWFFFIAGFATTMALGVWQVQRLEQKETLIARIKTAQEQTPVTTIPAKESALDALEFHYVKFKGIWLGDREFHVAARYFKGTVGYHIFRPLMLEDGRVALINRGWVPAAKKDAETRPETRVSGAAEFTAMVRIGPDRNYFTPANQPDKNMWFGRDVDAMADYADIKNVIPATFDVIGAQDTKTLPIPATGEISIRNDHLSYIITWFGIAAGILVIFTLAHRKKA